MRRLALSGRRGGTRQTGWNAEHRACRALAAGTTGDGTQLLVGELVAGRANNQVHRVRVPMRRRNLIELAENLHVDVVRKLEAGLGQHFSWLRPELLAKVSVLHRLRADLSENSL